MKESSVNISNSSVHEEHLDCGPSNFLFLSVIDILTFVIGQPVILKLMWTSLMSPKTPDILNSNLAVFHNVQYSISLTHLFILYLMPEKQTTVFTFLFVYVQTGGPMSLCFICLQRYVAVVRPLSYPLLRKYRYSEVCSATVWLVTLPTAFIFALTRDKISSHGVNIVYLLPSTMMIMMNGLMVQSTITIVRKLRKSGPGGDKTFPAKKKAYHAMLSMLVIGMFFYMPVLLMQKFTSPYEYIYNCITTPLCVCLLSAASVVHPIFFLVTQGRLFECLKGRKKRHLK